MQWETGCGCLWNLLIIKFHCLILLLPAALLGVVEKHSCSLPLVSELAATIPLMNGVERCHSTFQEIEQMESLPLDNLTQYYAQQNISEYGTTYSVGKFERHWPPAMKPLPMPRILLNQLGSKFIITGAKDGSLDFDQLMHGSNKEACSQSWLPGRSQIASMPLCCWSHCFQLICSKCWPFPSTCKTDEGGCIHWWRHFNKYCPDRNEGILLDNYRPPKNHCCWLTPLPSLVPSDSAVVSHTSLLAKAFRAIWWTLVSVTGSDKRLLLIWSLKNGTWVASPGIQ